MSEHAAPGRPSELVREVWCPSRTRCWQRATISGSEGDRLTLRLCETGELVPRVDAASLCDVDASHDEDLGDAAEMNSLHEGPLLHLLRRRLEERRAIYTWAGAVLISVNPYADVPLYGSESLLRAEAEAPGRAEPHIYAVARRALLALLGQPAADADADVIDARAVATGGSHALVISGESGAGKTEASKRAIEYLAFASLASRGGESRDSAGCSVEEHVSLTIPVLEAFGNAKTIRNNNSSRFGKFVRVHYDDDGRIEGATTAHYLLERSRLVGVAPDERNYHIF